MNGYGSDKLYRADGPSKQDIRGQGRKQVPGTVARAVSDSDREALVAFIHDVYIDYLGFALGRNYLTFSFLQLFAFVLLCENHELRERLAFEYALIDECQDTSEIQFKRTLPMAGTDNLCVVGDWKQSIFGFNTLPSRTSPSSSRASSGSWSTSTRMPTVLRWIRLRSPGSSCGKLPLDTVDFGVLGGDAGRPGDASR